MEFRRLRKEDDRSTFSCGSEEIDIFFKRFAGQNQFRYQIGTSYILTEGAQIAGFVTVASGSLTLPDEFRKQLPSYPLPVLLVARLGVDNRFQGQKLAKRLLRECCKLAVQQAEASGCCGLVTDAKPEAIGMYQKYGFIAIEDPDDSGIQRHFLSIKQFQGMIKDSDG